MELNSGNLGSQCEAVIVVLQGLMSSKVELVQGGVTGGVTGLELADICQQSHMSVTGCNRVVLKFADFILFLTFEKFFKKNWYKISTRMPQCPMQGYGGLECQGPLPVALYDFQHVPDCSNILREFIKLDCKCCLQQIQAITV